MRIFWKVNMRLLWAFSLSVISPTLKTSRGQHKVPRLSILLIMSVIFPLMKMWKKKPWKCIKNPVFWNLRRRYLQLKYSNTPCIVSVSGSQSGANRQVWGGVLLKDNRTDPCFSGSVMNVLLDLTILNILYVFRFFWCYSLNSSILSWLCLPVFWLVL